jgi:hypothetical protein
MDLVGRVVGLVAALGAGAVVALATASSASADDSSDGKSAPRPASAQHSDRSGSAIARRSDTTHAARRNSAAAAPAAGTAPVRPAAAVSAAGAPRSAPAATKSATEPVRPLAAAVAPPSTPPPAHEPIAAPSASAAVPGAAVMPAALPARDARGRLITVYKGLHFVLPGSPAFFVRKVSGTGTFTADSAYDLKDADQYDWNKFTGIVFSPLQHDRNSVMVGWRYNLTTEEFEIAPFYNVDKERILPDEHTEVISVPAGQTFQYTVDFSGVTISYGDKTVFKPYPQGLTPNVWTASRVSGWFGGNEAAPRTLTYYLNLK